MAAPPPSATRTHPCKVDLLPFTNMQQQLHVIQIRINNMQEASTGDGGGDYLWLRGNRENKGEAGGGEGGAGWGVAFLSRFITHLHSPKHTLSTAV